MCTLILDSHPVLFDHRGVYSRLVSLNVIRNTGQMYNQNQLKTSVLQNIFLRCFLLKGKTSIKR